MLSTIALKLFLALYLSSNAISALLNGPRLRLYTPVDDVDFGLSDGFGIGGWAFGTSFGIVCPPFSPFISLDMFNISYWSWRHDLNVRQADYKSATLPTELRQRKQKARHDTHKQQMLIGLAGFILYYNLITVFIVGLIPVFSSMINAWFFLSVCT